MKFILLKDNQLVEVHWHPKNIAYYTKLGYVYTKTGNSFMVKLKDLPKQSHAVVRVVCDYCGEEYFYKYQNYNNACNKELGDACPKCKYKKLKKSIQKKYGVDCVFQLQEIKDKSKETSLEKYGVEHYSQTLEYKEKVKETYLSHLKEGVITGPASSQQIAVNNLLKQIYGNSELNYPCGRCLLDCMVNVNNVKIDVEYDGVFWHNDKEDYDRRRNYFVLSEGYKILRIKGGHKIPSKKQLKCYVDKLINTDEKIIEIKVE